MTAADHRSRGTVTGCSVSYLQPADRAFDVFSPVVIHRPVGRRLSDIYVDDSMRPARSGKPTQRLSDVVYWRTHAVPGEQIQERSGAMVLVTRGGTFQPVRLSVPEPLLLESAFTHAAHAIQSDRTIIQDLLAEGVLVEGPSRLCRGPLARWRNQLLPESHPLVIDEPPSGLTRQADPDSPARSTGNRSFGRQKLPKVAR
jgi:hypothetical protein